MAREQSELSESQRSLTVGSDSTDSSFLDRRSYLKATGIAAGVFAGLGSTVAASDADVNIVEAGADDGGNRTINGVLDRVHGNGTTIYFPPGRYLLEPFRTGANNWRWVGEDATIVVPGSANRNYLHFTGNGWTFDGFTIDVSANGAAPVNFPRGNDWAFKNVVFEGRVGDPQYRSGSNLLNPNVDDAGATGLIENVIAADGSAPPDGSSNRGAMYVGPNNDGHLIIRNSHFKHFANNTLYVANIPGPVTIDGCLIEDSNVGVRIGGNTVVKDTVFDQRGPVPRARWSGGRAARGIWINSNSYIAGDIEIEGCDFLMNGPQGAHAIFSRRRLDGIEIRDCRIHQRDNHTGIEFADGGSGATIIEDTSIVGNSSRPGVRLVGRNGARIRNVCIRKSNTGIQLRNSSNVSVRDSTINTGGPAIDGNAATSNVSNSGSCPAPSAEWEPGESGSDGDGSDGSDDSDDEQNGDDEPEGIPIRLEGTGEYVIEVTGDVEPAPEIARWVEEGRQYEGGRIEWYLNGSWTKWYVTGEIETLEVEDSSAITVTVDGEEVDPERYPESDDDGENDGDAEDDGDRDAEDDGDDEATTIRLEGAGEYVIEVTGDVEPAPEIAQWVEEGRQYEGGRIEWYLTGSWTEWHVTGEIETLEVDDPSAITVTVDGEEVDPERYPESDDGDDSDGDEGSDGDGDRDAEDDEDRESRLRLEGTAEYLFEVSGEVRPAEAIAQWVEEGRQYEGNRVEWYLNDSWTEWVFTGTIETFEIANTRDLAITLDGKPINPDRL